MNKKNIIITAFVTVIILIVIIAGGYLFNKKDLAAVDSEQLSNSDSIQKGNCTTENSINSQNVDVDTKAKTTANDSKNDNDTSDSGNVIEGGKAVAKIKIDLDGDKKEELLEIIEKSTGKGNDRKLEGIIRVSDSSGTKTKTYLNKPADYTGIFSDIACKDLNGDGLKEIFVTIPDRGASFNLNYFYIYSYRTGNYFAYTPQEPSLNLIDITQGFTFDYIGNGKIKITNESYKFSGIIDISDTDIPDAADADKAYNQSWVEPAPLEINSDSRLSLIGDKPGEIYIRLPLAIFGQATSDIIGSVEAWYKVDNSLTPILKKLEIFDFNRDMTIKSKIGEVIVG